jgi:hypothetical protein
MRFSPTRLSILLAAAAALLAARPAAAQRPEPDSVEVVAYRMTDDALAKVRVAAQAVIDALGRDPAGGRPTGQEVPEERGVVTRLENEFARRPAMRAAVEASGLTVREFTHFWLAVAFSQMAGENDTQGRFAWYPAENVRFYREHAEEIDALYAAMQAAGEAAERTAGKHP